MSPCHRLDAQLAEAYAELARKVVVLGDRTKECREARRQMLDARQRLERLLLQSQSVSDRSVH
jgi:hypothetical protein